MCPCLVLLLVAGVAVVDVANDEVIADVAAVCGAVVGDFGGAAVGGAAVVVCVVVGDVAVVDGDVAVVCGVALVAVVAVVHVMPMLLLIFVLLLLLLALPFVAVGDVVADAGADVVLL